MVRALFSSALNFQSIHFVQFCPSAVRYAQREDPKIVYSVKIGKPIDHIAISPDGSVVAISLEGQIYFYKASDGTQIDTIPHAHGGKLKQLLARSLFVESLFTCCATKPQARGSRICSGTQTQSFWYQRPKETAAFGSGKVHAAYLPNWGPFHSHPYRSHSLPTVRKTQLSRDHLCCLCVCSVEHSNTSLWVDVRENSFKGSCHKSYLLS